MSEFWLVLFVILLVLTLIAIVGHGIWIGAAFFIRMLFGGGGDAPGRTLRCPQCRRGEVVQGRCSACGLVLYHNEPMRAAAPPPPVDERAIVAKHVRRMYEAEAIDELTFVRVMAGLQGTRAAELIVEESAVPESAAVPVGPVHETVPPVPVELREQARPASGAAELEEWGVPPLPVEPIVPPPPLPQPLREARPPRRPMSELLEAFMEESNIRWGELVGGLLIVGCSIALVFTFWDWIAVRPWFKFFLFTAITGAVFATGLYTEHRWRLPNTSRGLLLIATLLVPLNFLAIAAFSRDVGTLALARIGGEVVALALFGWLVWWAGKVITPGWSILLAAGVLGPSVAQVVVHRFAPTASPVGAVALACLPLFFYLGSTLAAIRSAWRWDSITRIESNRFFTFLGAVSFPAVVPLGLLAFNVLEFRVTLERIAPAVGLYGLPALAAGLFLFKRLEAEKQLAGSRTAGTSVTVLGALVLIGSMVLAWPNAASLLCASLLNFAILTAAAVVFAIPAGHLLALPCAVLVFLLGFHLTAGHVSDPGTPGQLLRTLLSASSGVALVPVVALIAIAAEWMRRRSRGDHAWFYLAACSAVAVASLALVSFHGFGRSDDHGATWVYAIYTLAAFAGAWHLRRVEALWAAGILLAATLAQAMAFRLPVAERLIDRWTIAILAHASVFVGLMLVGRIVVQVRDVFAKPLAKIALWSSIVAVVLIGAAAVTAQGLAEHALLLAGTSAWLAVVWFAISTANVWPSMFTAFQAALAGSLLFAVTHVLQGRDWFANATHPLADPWTWQTYGVALGLLSAVWIGVRLFVQRRLHAAPGHEDIVPLLRPGWPTVDRCINWLLFFVLLAMSAYAVWPGVAMELSDRVAPAVFSPQSVVLHQHARDWGAWLLLGVTVATLIGSLRETADPKYAWAAVTALACACALFAARWEDATAGASALRWTVAGFLLIASAVIWARDRIKIFGPHWQDVRTLTLLLTIVPILTLTIVPAAMMLSGTNIVGPAGDSFFGSITSAASYLLPLGIVTFVLVGHAVRERSGGFAFAAGLIVNLSVTLAYALLLVQDGVQIGLAEQIRLVQLNAIASALFALAWGATWRFPIAREDRGLAAPPLLLQLHLGIAAVALLCLIVPATWRIYAAPALDPAIIAEVGNLCGWGAALLICASAALIYRPTGTSAATALGAAAIFIGPLAALSLCRGATTAWTGYHALIIAFAAAAGFVLGLGWIAQFRSSETVDALDDSHEAERSPVTRARRSATTWASLFGCLTLALAFRALDADPASPTWTLAGIVATSLLAVGLAIQTLRGEWLYPAGFLLNAAATIAWQHYARTSGAIAPFLELVQVNALVLACSGIATLALELFVLRPMRSQVVRRGFAPFHHLAAILSVILVSALGFFLMVEATLNPILTWSTLAATLALLTTTLWDEDANYPIKCLYALGLATLASAMAWFYRFGDMLEIGPLALAAYSLLCGFFYTQRTSLAEFAERTGIPLRRHWPADHAGWLAAATFTISLLVSLLAFGQVTGNASMAMRLAMGTSVIAVAVALGLMASNEKPTFTHYAALLFGAFGVVLWGWAWIDPTRAMLLERLVILMLVLAGMTGFYAVGLVKVLRLDDVWTRAAHRLVPILGTLAGGCLLGILGVEFANYRPTGTPIATAAAIAVVLAFAGLAAGCILCAVVPGKDPFDLSERGRTIYVYAAELLLILLFVHIKLVWPDLLQIGIWRRYWPIIIILISFLGVGLAEVFRRQNRMVLAEPMEHTGALLPIVPVITFFMFGSQTHYAHVLFLTAIVYGALAVMRTSFVFGVLSALAGNGGLWYLLYQTQHLGFFSHPQLWLIPAALSVLAAAQLNKDRLSRDQMRVIRYITVMIVYASSTADILISGLTEAPHLPLILALLSVAGVMTGILLRIQSFLFLGTTFLLVAVAAMVQYASLQVDGAWPWLIAGILLGAAIVTLFALFEKKRNDMLALVENLKEWQA